MLSLQAGLPGKKHLAMSRSNGTNARQPS